MSVIKNEFSDEDRNVSTHKLLSRTFTPIKDIGRRVFLEESKYLF